ncbi:MAG: nuclear transport factor 2 family protein [Longimicrobiales bacterium]
MSQMTDADREQLRHLTEVGWVDACMAKDWDAAVGMCTEDVNYMAADLPLLQGRDALKGFLSGFPDMSEFQQTLVSIAGDAELAVMQVSFGGTFGVDGQDMSADGKGLASATKRDGEWQFSAVCWNWNAPPAPAD